MRKLPIILASIICAPFAGAWDLSEKYKGPKNPVSDTTWHADILPGYESRFVNQGEAFDGPCRSTIIRKFCKNESKKAYLYIHGFNDYFFQKEMGEIFTDSGFNFYAVDLRRYGRSREPWQYPFNVRRQDEYFADIDSAISQIKRDGNTDITLSGHSTGGLTVAYMAAVKGDGIGVDRIVTDSPFLEWNYSAFMRDMAIPVVSFLGKIFKNAKIKQAHCDGYAYSLLKEYDGEWTYDTDWKMVYSPPVTWSWVGAINSAQSTLMKNRENIKIPILVMHSNRKISGCNYTPEFQTGDAVLDPAMIKRQGSKLGNEATRQVSTIENGIHDLILSRENVREAAYDTIFNFIRKFR